MKIRRTFALAAGVALASSASASSVYGDSTGEVFDAGLTHLDISSVTLSNDSDFLYISVQTTGDLDATTWGKYAIGINNGKDASSAGNGWGRNIDWGGQTITHWSATWADDPGGIGTGIGAEIYEFDGANFNLTGATYNGSSNISADDSQHGSGVQMWAISLASLNLVAGDTFTFDVITTGGTTGDPGVDHLSRNDQSTPFWDTQSVAGAFLSYTVTAPIPLPTAGALAGVALLGVGVRRRR